MLDEKYASLEVVVKGQYLDYTSNIIYMVGLDLSHNNLVGFFVHWLCGPPVSRNCSGPQMARGYPNEHQSDSDVRYLYVGIAVGFVLSLWVVFVTFLFARTWRAAYFQLFDKLLCGAV
jgi:hypothetical protein